MLSGAEIESGLPPGGGEAGRLIRARDWSLTPLGPIARWPQSLKSALGLVLHSPVPMVMLWGEDGVMLYNDAYSVFAGGRHPQLLGSKVREGWPEVAEFNDNVMRVGLAGGTLAYRDQALTLYRHGYPETVWMNLDYSPLFDDSGRPAGVIAVVVETSQEVLAREALKIERDRARDVLEGMGDGFMLLDRDFTVLEINAEGLRIDGRAREEIVGRSHWEVWPQSWNIDAGRTYREVMKTRRPGSCRDSYLFPDGRNLVFDVRCYPVADGAAVFFRDITAQAEAEQRLAFSEESLRLATDAAEVGAWDLDLDTDVLTWSDRTKAVFGISPGAPVSMLDFYNGLHPDDRDATSAAFEAALDPARRAQYDVEYRTIGKEDGLTRWVAAKGKGLFDPQGRCVRALGTAIDITERKLADQRLRDSETRLRELNATLEQRVSARTRERDSAWNNTQDLLTVIGTDGVFRAANPAWTRVLGYAPEAVVGRHIEDLIWPEDVPAFLAALEHAAGDVLAPFENRHRHANGGFRWISWTAAPDENGLVHASGRHITAEKEAREALAVAEEALRQSQKMEAVGQLTGGIAHDFNNLLTIIRSSAEFLRRRDLPEDRRARYADAIAETADRAAKLTSQLLAFARRQPLRPEVFDASARLASVAEMIRPLVGSRIRVVLNCPSDPVPVEADIAQFETSLVNLAINARDAMEGEGVLNLDVEVAAGPPPARKTSPAGSSWARVVVRDTGQGIAPENLGRIFEPFFTTKEVGKGTGLGLSQVFGFVKQSGGEVTVESAAGAGACFVLWLPCLEQTALLSALNQEPTSDPAPRVSGARVLVVEDNAAVGAFSTQMLQDLGYVTTLADNASLAMTLLDEGRDRFDVVFSDVVMPGMSGVDFARLVRRRWGDLPVLLTSGYSHVLAEEGAREFPLLHKPYSVGALARALRETLANPTQARARAPA